METAGIQKPPTDFREQFAPATPPIGLPWRLSLATGVLFLLSIFVYFGLRFGYRTYLEKQDERLLASLETLAKQVSSEDQEQFVTLYSQIVNLKTVLDQHRFAANIFPLLEREVVSGVFFTSANFDAATRRLQLDGSAASLGGLAVQVAEFGKAPEVATVTVDKVNLSGNVATFSISLAFKSSSLARPIAF